MKLSQTAIRVIKSKEITDRLQESLGFTPYWTGKVIKANKSNGPLTKAQALMIISEMSGLTLDKILVAEPGDEPGGIIPVRNLKEA
jgi:hypothetical protein